MLKRRWIHAVVSFLALLCLSTQQIRAADSVVPAVLADWKARQKLAKTARYELAGQIQNFDLDTDKPQPVSLVVLIDFETKRVRIEKNSMEIKLAYAPLKPGEQKSETPRFDGYEFIENQNVIAFNGQSFTYYSPKKEALGGKENANLSIAKNNFQHNDYGNDLWPIFEAHGIVSTHRKPMRPDDLPLDHKPETLFDRGTVTQRGRSCNVIGDFPLGKQKPIDEFTIDREKGSAITTHVHGSPNVRLHWDVVHEKKAIGWMPARWTQIYYDNGGKASVITTLAVKRVEYDLPVRDADFTVVPKTGDRVSEYRYPDPNRGLNVLRPATKTSNVEESGRWVKIKETGFWTEQGRELPPEPEVVTPMPVAVEPEGVAPNPEPVGWNYWLLAIPIAIIALVVIIVWGLRKKVPGK